MLRDEAAKDSFFREERPFQAINHHIYLYIFIYILFLCDRPCLQPLENEILRG